MTPFGRQPVSAGLLASQALAQRKPSVDRVKKWDVFHNLCAARTTIGVTDRDLTVLQALLSFFPEEDLSATAQMRVFPSNRTLAERAHGMAESTLRRHLAALVRAGLILRHDSPNGKRYARRDHTGEIEQAFGFDLRILLVRAEEIEEAGRAARALEAERKRVRETCVLMCRDAVKLLVYGMETCPNAQNWDAIDDALRLTQRALRRKLSLEDLEAQYVTLQALMTRLRDLVVVDETEEMDGKDVHSERHLQISKTHTLESEPAKEKAGARGDVSRLPLMLILKACADLQTYRPDGIQTWDDLIEAAEFVRGMIGISSDAWVDAIKSMGAVDAAITVAAILERIGEISSPGGYLRALSRKAADGQFSTGPMIMALLNTRDKRAA